MQKAPPRIAPLFRAGSLRNLGIGRRRQKGGSKSGSKKYSRNGNSDEKICNLDQISETALGWGLALISFPEVGRFGRWLLIFALDQRERERGKINQGRGVLEGLIGLGYDMAIVLRLQLEVAVWIYCLPKGSDTLYPPPHPPPPPPSSLLPTQPPSPPSPLPPSPFPSLLPSPSPRE